MAADKVFSNSFLLDRLDWLYMQEGKVTTRKIDSCSKLPNSKTIIDRFGTLEKALNKLGLEPNYKHWTKLGVRTAIVWKIRELDRLPTRQEIIDDNGCPGSYGTVLRVLGGNWREDKAVVKERIKAKQRRITKAGKISVKGVTKFRGKYRARRTKGKRKSLGVYQTKRAANKAKLEDDILQLKKLID